MFEPPSRKGRQGARSRDDEFYDFLTADELRWTQMQNTDQDGVGEESL